MTPEQLRAFRRAAMDRGDHHSISLCNRALCPNVPSNEFHELVAEIAAREDYRNRDVCHE